VESSLSSRPIPEKEFAVPLYMLPPAGRIESTDLFLNTLKVISGKEIPEGIKKERGRLLDGMFDSHKHNFQGQAVIFGEPEQVYSATRLCLENGLFPRIMATGSRTKQIDRLLGRTSKGALTGQEYVRMSDSDFFPD
jgi:nitrogenase molybdenum-iron protein NifN